MSLLVVLLGSMLVCSNSFSQAPGAPQFIKVDLAMNGVTYKGLDQEGKWITTTRQWTASVVLGSNTWRMESEFASNARDFRYCDGTNVYFATDIHFIPEGNYAIQPANSVGPNRNVVIIPGVHPMGDFNANLVWLAYCSGTYLQYTNHVLPLPGSEVRHDLSAFAVRDRSILSEMPPFLPNRVEFVLDKENFSKAKDSVFVFRSVDHPTHTPPGEDGMLRGIYQAEAFTNFAGWTVPIAFSYTQYTLPVGVAGSELRYVDTGKVIAITETSAPKSLLDDGQPHFIEDTRFRDPEHLIDSLRYQSAN